MYHDPSRTALQYKDTAEETQIHFIVGAFKEQD